MQISLQSCFSNTFFKKHLGALPTSALSFLLFVYLACWVLVAAYGIFVASHGSFLVVRSAVSVVVTRGLSCSMACGILVLRRDQTHIPCLAGQILNHWATREVPFIVFFCLFHVNVVFKQEVKSSVNGVDGVLKQQVKLHIHSLIKTWGFFCFFCFLAMKLYLNLFALFHDCWVRQVIVGGSMTNLKRISTFFIFGHTLWLCRILVP